MEALLALINQKIADFSATAFKNGEVIDVSNEDISGKWAIFFFYPADFTYVCPTELEDLANYHDELLAMDVEVYAVSTDSHFCHKAWHDNSDTVGKIKYTMISDNTFEISRNFK